MFVVSKWSENTFQKLSKKLTRKIFYGFCSKEYVIFDSSVIRVGAYELMRELRNCGEGALRSNGKHLMREKVGGQNSIV